VLLSLNRDQGPLFPRRLGLLARLSRTGECRFNSIEGRELIPHWYAYRTEWVSFNRVFPTAAEFPGASQMLASRSADQTTLGLPLMLRFTPGKQLFQMHGGTAHSARDKAATFLKSTSNLIRTIQLFDFLLASVANNPALP
jgi:hypothetical protein